MFFILFESVLKAWADFARKLWFGFLLFSDSYVSTLITRKCLNYFYLFWKSLISCLSLSLQATLWGVIPFAFFVGIWYAELVARDSFDWELFLGAGVVWTFTEVTGLPMYLNGSKSSCFVVTKCSEPTRLSKWYSVLGSVSFLVNSF